jgi:fused signal recognition particle receptor
MSIQSANKIENSVKQTKESWFNKIAGIFKRSRIDAETWDELEELLILADVGVTTTTELIQRVKQQARQEKVEDGDSVRDILKKEMVRLLTIESSIKDILAPADNMTVILVIGVNGSGKTTSIAKLANQVKSRGNQVLLAAADTFRAAAIDQLKHWADKAGVQVIAHQPGGPRSSCLRFYTGCSQQEYKNGNSGYRRQTAYQVQPDGRAEKDQAGNR